MCRAHCLGGDVVALKGGELFKKAEDKKKGRGIGREVEHRKVLALAEKRRSNSGLAILGDNYLNTSNGIYSYPLLKKGGTTEEAQNG